LTLRDVAGLTGLLAAGAVRRAGATTGGLAVRATAGGKLEELSFFSLLCCRFGAATSNLAARVTQLGELRGRKQTLSKWPGRGAVSRIKTRLTPPADCSPGGDVEETRKAFPDCMPTELRGIPSWFRCRFETRKGGELLARKAGRMAENPTRRPAAY